MRLKKSIIITLFFCLMMIGSVSAASDNDTLSSDVSEKVQTHTDTHQIDKSSNDDIKGEDVKTDEKTKTSTNNLIKEKDTHKLSATKKDIIKENDKTKSITDLKDSISGNITNGNYEITLEHDYKYSINDNLAEGIVIEGSDNIYYDGIIIGTDKTLTINGNGKTIDCDGKAKLFNVVSRAKLKLENLTITNCNSVAGGAICGSNGISITIINCTLKNNIATGTVNNAGGGAIFADYSTIIIINSTLENNTSYYSGGAICTSGFGECTVSITNSTFNNNTATNNGGAIYIYDIDTLFLTYSTLQNNKAESGSAIYWEYGNGNNIQFNKFIDNQDNFHSVNIGGNVPTNNKFLTMPVFEIGHISDFVNGDSIKITVSEKNGITDELNVNLTIGTEVYPIELKNGIGEKTITPNLNPGHYKAILNFTETDKFMSTSAESNEFQIKPKVINSNIKIENIPNFEVGQEIIIHVTADNAFTNELNITINGTQYPITITNGTGLIKITPNLKPGEYNATINYPGDEIYLPLTVTSNKFRVRNITELLDTIKQLKEQINELIKANKTLNKNITDLQTTITELENRITELEKLKTNITRLEAEISELKLNNTKLLEKIYILNNTIQDQNVTKLQNEINELKNYFKAQIDELIENNTKLAEKINTQNDMINQLNITIQNQNITPLKLPIEIVGNINVTPSSYTEIINKLDQILKNTPTPPTNQPNVSQEKVTKKATKITAKKKTFKRKVKIKKYKATLKSGKKRVAKVYLYITIKGKKYKKTLKAKTNNKGKAIFKIKKLTKKGKYTATINYKGDKNYKPSKRTVKIIIK